MNEIRHIYRHGLQVHIEEQLGMHRSVLSSFLLTESVLAIKHGDYVTRLPFESIEPDKYGEVSHGACGDGTMLTESRARPSCCL